MSEERSAESFVAEWFNKIRINTRRSLLKGIGDKLCDLGQVIQPLHSACEKGRMFATSERWCLKRELYLSKLINTSLFSSVLGIEPRINSPSPMHAGQVVFTKGLYCQSVFHFYFGTGSHEFAQAGFEFAICIPSAQ